jgi:hypothetical protein
MTTCKFARVLLLSSTHSHHRIDEQMLENRLRFCTPGPQTEYDSDDSKSDLATTAEALGWSRIGADEAKARDAFSAMQMPHIPAGSSIDANAMQNMLNNTASMGVPSPPDAIMKPSSIRGGGITAEFLKQSIATDADVLAAVVFAVDGNNAPDGILLAQNVDDLMHHSNAETFPEIPKESWKTPSSWQHAFGAVADAAIYS